MRESTQLDRKEKQTYRERSDLQQHVCDLCGLPLGRSRIEETTEGHVLRFCCPGCRHVFLLLSEESGSLPQNFKETELYRACVESGIIPNGRDDAPAPSVTREEPDIPALELTLRVEGMWCPACGWLIEEVLRKSTGVLQPRVSFLADMIQMKYFPHMVSPSEIANKLSRLGYRTSSFLEAGRDAAGKHDLLTRLGVSAILSVNVMMVSCALYFGFFETLSSTVIGYFSYPLLAMATPVVFYGGLPILRRAASGLRYGVTSMDTLISLGVLAAYIYSILQMARGSIHLYFDTACMVVTLALLGKYIETQARRKVSASIDELHELASRKVRLHSGDRERWVSADAVNPGACFIVQAEERVPVDGRIISGSAWLDESIITGESRPVQRGSGDEVLAGSLLREGPLVLTATRVGSESSVRQMLTLVREALDRKNRVELIADRITGYFVPAVLSTAVIAGLALWFAGVPKDEILGRSLAVLLISCPCALGIATPLVKVAMIGIGRSKGILIRDAEAIERARDLDVLVLDKTGTMTEGNFVLHEVIAKGLSEHEVLSCVAAVEQESTHFLARETVRRARESGMEIREADQVEEFEGRGVKGVVGKSEVMVGNKGFMKEQKVRVPADLETTAANRQRKGMTVLFFAWERDARGILVFGDKAKAGARELVRKLRDRGVGVWLVSGDAEETTAATATLLGIEHFRGQVLPAEKANFIQTLKREGHTVGMVGDGMNDAAALAHADVGVALGAGSNIMREASDVTILSAQPSRILDVFDLSELTTRTIRQNLMFAFLYNGMAIPLALSGLLSPLIAVLAMFGSSFSVIGNALRISRRKKESLLTDFAMEALPAPGGGNR